MRLETEQLRLMILMYPDQIQIQLHFVSLVLTPSAPAIFTVRKKHLLSLHLSFDDFLCICDAVNAFAGDVRPARVTAFFGSHVHSLAESNFLLLLKADLP